MTIEFGKYRLDLSTPKVMAIINVTPDSFYEGSRTTDSGAIEKRVDDAMENGASILDVGGYSSRPGAADISAEEEIERISGALEIIRMKYPDTAVSVDTFRAGVAEECFKRYGAFIVNDITAGEHDPAILDVAARCGLPYIAMHMRGTPQTMQEMTAYGDVAEDVEKYFAEKLVRFTEAGITQVILDPGFGFAKTVEQNYALLGQMHRLRRFGLPLLAGISRKTMIWKPLGITPSEALTGTVALNWECLRQGASILRVHDTREATEVIKLYEVFKAGAQPHRLSFL